MRLMRNLGNRESRIYWKRHSRKYEERSLQKEDEIIFETCIMVVCYIDNVHKRNLM